MVQDQPKEEVAKEWDFGPESRPLLGKIEFVGEYNVPSHVALVDKNHENDAQKLHKIFVDKWNIKDAGMIITVTGSAKDMKMSPRLKELFRSGLVKAAKDSNAIITTGGTNYGVMMHVGKAMREYSNIGDTSKSIPCIGFASFARFQSEKVQDKFMRHFLDGDIDSNGVEVAKPYQYAKNKDFDKAFAAIDPNHNFFVLATSKSEASTCQEST